MRHAVIINHHQLFLPGVRDLIRSIERDANFEVIHWRQNQISNLKQSTWSSVSLLGNFQKLDKSQFQPLHIQDDELIKFWSGLSMPRVWICFLLDIHVGLNGMFFGKATKNKLDAKDLVQKFFDAIAWSYEHTLFDCITSNTENIWEQRNKVAHETRNYLIKSFKSRLDFPWAIDPLPYKTNKFKIFDICVPGAQYPARVEFEERIRSKFKLAPIQKIDQNLIRILSYSASFLPFIKSNHILLKARFREINMRRFLKFSKFAFTDGGTYLDYFVRKYLEIPASGAILICRSTDSLNMYGFKENLHFLNLDDFPVNGIELDSLYDKFCKNFELVQEFLQEKHSFERRINQLKSFLNLLINSGPSRGYFFDGNFVLESS